ncbi:MAG: FAD-binding oxidoreductase [Desulfatiglandaceae bacterium]
MPVCNPDVIIIGGGVIGASICYHLARERVRVVLLERDGLAAGSSGACDGLLLLQSKKPGIHTSLAIESIEMIARLAGELPLDVEFERKGGLVVMETEEEYQAMAGFAAERRLEGIDVSLLDAAQARGLEPSLSPEVCGATFCPSEGQINPMALTLAFAKGASQMGARIIQGEEVRGINLSRGRVSGVVTDKQAYETKIVVNAAGVFASEIGRMAGLDMPIIPRRGQLVVTAAVPPILDRCLISAGYIAAKFNPEGAGGARAGGVSIEQTRSGNFLLGSTREFVGFDRRTNFQALKRIVNRAVTIIPGLSEYNIIRSFAGLRPYTPDGLPILGRVDAVPGLVVAAGHEGDGITLSAVTGKLISELIVDGRPHVPLDEFRCERFDERFQ